jgi:NO-binding membrane sensor protein with MHYT domain
MPHDHSIQYMHDPVLMLLSFLVSVLGSFTALQLAVAIPSAQDAGQRWRAILGSGLAMGGGAIWAMHFIAMLACKMDSDATISYDLVITAGSAVVAVVSCTIGLAIVGSGVFGLGKLILAGLLMGLGVTGMHYSGMSAILMPADIHYDTMLVVASAVIAVVASIVALWLAFNLRGRLQMFGSAVVMGIAVCGMHYTGMAAASFVPNPAKAVSAGISSANLGMSIFAVTTVLLATMLSVSILRQRQREMVAI